MNWAGVEVELPDPFVSMASRAGVSSAVSSPVRRSRRILKVEPEFALVMLCSSIIKKEYIFKSMKMTQLWAR